MRVSQIHFQAFKSLYDVTCDLDQFTVITGANGAGKSNLVDALNFLGEVYADGLEFAVGRAGGYENIAHRRTRRAKKPVALTVTATLDANEMRRMVRHLRRRSEITLDDDASFVYHHRFALSTTTQSVLADYQVREDVVELRDHRGRSVIRASRTDNSRIRLNTNKRRIRDEPWLQALISPMEEPEFVRYLGQRPIRPGALIIDELFYYTNIFNHIRSALAGIRLFQLSPYQCRTPGVPTPNATLERHGENLPGAADHLRRTDRIAWTRVQSAMRSIMPGLEEIQIVYTEDRRLALQFRERGVGRPWNTGEVSDGTIQALAMFIALFDRRYPLLVVEEPENAIHPWILRQFLDLCLESQKQIIATTHSPVALNYVDPSIVRLMAISNGRSSLDRMVDASGDLAAVVGSGDVSLFDAYDSGMLVQALPRGFVDDDVIASDDE